jgi:hypothetical protein
MQPAAYGILLAGAGVLLSAVLIASPAPPRSNRCEQGECAQRSRIFAELSAKRFAAVEELLDGKRSFRQTAEMFRGLSAEDPFDIRASLRILCQTGSDDTLFYWQVMNYVRARSLRERIDETALRKIEGEFRKLTELEVGRD